MSDSFGPERKYKKLMEQLNAAGRPHFSKCDKEYKVKILKDSSVEPGMFVPDCVVTGSYRAHPITIRAMRKDIFVAGNELFQDLEMLYTCSNCSKSLDLQFWHFCPYCEATFLL